MTRCNAANGGANVSTLRECIASDPGIYRCMASSSARPEDNPRAIPGLVIRETAGEVLVHDPATGKIHILNQSGALVLRACDGAHSLEAIVDDLVAQTGAERARVTIDVATACDAFRAQGLIS